MWPRGVLLGWKGEELWLWAEMNPSFLAPTAPAKLLCDPELSSALVRDIFFPIKEDKFEAWMRVLPPK